MHPRLEHRSNTLKCHRHLEESSGKHKAPRDTMGNWRLCKAFALDHAPVAKMASVLGVRLLLVWPSKLSAWGLLIWKDINVDCKQIMLLTGGGGYSKLERLIPDGFSCTPGHVHRYCKWCRGRSHTNQLVCFRSV